MSVEIVLINLDRSPDRLAFMSDQLGRLGLPFTRLPATDGSHIAQDEFDRLSRTYMRPITRSELGCLTSHVQAWRHCVETGRSILVLEDDVLLSGRLRDFLGEVETLDLPGLINLETRGTDKRVSRNPVAATKSGVRLYRLLIDNGGTAAYVVSPSAAGALLELSGTYAAPADAFIDHSGVPRLQTDPGLVTLSNEGFASTVVLPTRRERNALALRHPHFKLRRLAGYVSKTFRKLGTAGNSATRTIAACPTILARADNRSA